VVTDVAKTYPDVALDHMLVDTCAMRIAYAPSSFDVVLTENMFGDILSDEAGAIVGSLGLLPSASLGDGAGLYEPVHGSAPDIAGKGIANPVGTVASAAMLLRYSLKLDEEASAIERAIERALSDGARTADLAGGGASISTAEMTDRIVSALESSA
jgi:3-isopropylmalate dehydrogenase